MIGGIGERVVGRRFWKRVWLIGELERKLHWEF